MPLLLRWALLLGASVVSQTSIEIDYAVALREQGLFHLAELQCRAVLQDPRLDHADATRAAIELSKTLSARALNAREAEQAAFWALAADVLDEAGRRAPPQPEASLLEMQKALIVLEQAEWERRVTEVRARRPDDWNGTREQLRQAIKLWRHVQTLWANPRTRAGDRGLPSVQVEELLRNAKYQLARGYRNQAITYPAKSSDRINALTAALQELQPLATSSVPDDLVWQSRIDRIQCVRLLGDVEQARALLEELGPLPPAYRGALAAEGIRVALAAKQPEAAKQLVLAANETAHTPELELARVETWLALAEQESDPAAAREYQARAAQIAASLGREQGTYWGLRGEMLISQLATQQGGNAETAIGAELLETAATTFLRRGLPDDAIAVLVRAAEHAEEQQDDKAAFDYRYQAAAVEHREGRLQPAVDRFRDVALKYPHDSRASSAHLLATFDAAALYQQSLRDPQAPITQQKLGQYTTLLEEHLERWPEEPSADQARFWFGRLESARGNWDRAEELFKVVKAGSPQAAAAMTELGKVYEAVLQPSQEGFVERLRGAREFLANRLPVVGEAEEQVSLVIEAARLQLMYQPVEYANAEALARFGLSQTATQQQQELLRVHLVTALAGRTRMDQADTELNASLPLTAAALSELLRGLQVVRDQRPLDSLLGDLVRNVLLLLNTYRDQLTPSARLLVQQCQADIAPPDDAKANYQGLAQENPDQLRIQMRYAELLSLGRDRQSRNDALKQWRIVLGRSRPQTYYWYRAKLGVAQTHFDMGHPDKAQAVLELTLSLHPQLSEMDLYRDYQALLDRCRG